MVRIISLPGSLRSELSRYEVGDGLPADDPMRTLTDWTIKDYPPTYTPTEPVASGVALPRLEVEFGI